MKNLEGPTNPEYLVNRKAEIWDEFYTNYDKLTSKPKSSSSTSGNTYDYGKNISNQGTGNAVTNSSGAYNIQTQVKGSNILNAKINPNDYDEDEEYDKNANDPLRGGYAKDRERKQINDALGKRGSKEREQQSGELHGTKKGGRNDDNKSWGDLKKGNYWIQPQPGPAPIHIQPTPNPDANQNQGSSTIGNKVGEAAGWAAAGTVIYWVVSEVSRVVFPPRNLIPVP